MGQGNRAIKSKLKTGERIDWRIFSSFRLSQSTQMREGAIHGVAREREKHKN
jgi:hypothetical protein